MAYNGTVDLISGIRPKNNGTFPIADASHIRYTDNERVDAALNGTVRFDKAQGLTDAQKEQARENIGAGEVDATLSIEGMAADAKKTGDEIAGLKGDLSDVDDVVTDISELIGTKTIETYDYIPVSFSVDSQTVTSNGITFVQNTDKTVRAYGTNTGATSFFALKQSSGEINVPLSGGKKYRLSGCPSGGSPSTYQLDIRAGSSPICVDYGDGVTVDIVESTSCKIMIRIAANAIIDVIFRPKLDEVIVTTETVDEYSANDKVVRINLWLLEDEIPDTTQTYTFTNGAVSQVTHSGNGTVIRTDTFTYGESTITEVRTLNTGESLTIVTNLTTLETSVTFAAA